MDSGTTNAKGPCFTQSTIGRWKELLLSAPQIFGLGIAGHVASNDGELVGIIASRNQRNNLLNRQGSTDVIPQRKVGPLLRKIEHVIEHNILMARQSFIDRLRDYHSFDEPEMSASGAFNQPYGPNIEVTRYGDHDNDNWLN